MQKSWRKSMFFFSIFLLVFTVYALVDKYTGINVGLLWLWEVASFPFLLLAIWTKPLSKYSRELILKAEIAEDQELK